MSLNHGKEKEKNKLREEKRMDLKKLDSVKASEEGVWVPIFASDERTGIEILALGIDSKKFKQKSTELRKYLQKQQERKANEDIEEMDTKLINMLVALTLDWRDTSEEGVEAGADKSGLIVEGEVLKFNKENAFTVYSSYPLIPEQVLAYISDRAHFLEM